MEELQKEILKYNMLNQQQSIQPHQTQFTEILALLIFAFMVMVYFREQRGIPQSSALLKSNEPKIYYIDFQGKSSKKETFYDKLIPY